MVSLITVIAILVACYFLQGTWPFVAGLLAVVPVKIVATALMALESGGGARMQEAVEGMVIGQFAVGVLLLVFYWFIKQGN